MDRDFLWHIYHLFSVIYHPSCIIYHLESSTYHVSFVFIGEGVDCKIMKETKPKTAFAEHFRENRSGEKWRCLACQFPSCIKCGRTRDRKKQEANRQAPKDYVCEDCQILQKCHKCKKTKPAHEYDAQHLENVRGQNRKATCLECQRSSPAEAATASCPERLSSHRT